MQQVNGHEAWLRLADAMLLLIVYNMRQSTLWNAGLPLPWPARSARRSAHTTAAPNATATAKPAAAAHMQR